MLENEVDARGSTFPLSLSIFISEKLSAVGGGEGVSRHECQDSATP